MGFGGLNARGGLKMRENWRFENATITRV